MSGLPGRVGPHAPAQPRFRHETVEPDVITLHYRGEVGTRTPDAILTFLRGLEVEYRSLQLHPHDHKGGRGHDFDVILWTDWRKARPTPHKLAGLVNEALEADARALGYSVQWFIASTAYAEYLAEQAVHRDLKRELAASKLDGAR